MKIHYFSGEAWEEAYVRAKLPGEDITFHEGSLAQNHELMDPEAQVICTFIESPIGEAEMNRFPALKLIATRSTGFDHIDLAAAKAHGVIVVNVEAESGAAASADILQHLQVAV
jgi:D-lactate dehydrogenase